MNRMGWLPGVALLLLFMARPSGAQPVFIETFDTVTADNRGIFNAGSENIRIRQGVFVLSYSSQQSEFPNGIVYTPPNSGADPETREITMHFLGDARSAQTSNSVFVGYSLSAGRGLALPPLPGGAVSNDRTGYILRLIKHGDGTNEIKVYRDDEGWSKEIFADTTLGFNPVACLRRIRIRHDRDGRHVVTGVFDTGLPISRTWSFMDAEYPPDDVHRSVQLAAKGHAIVNTTYQIVTDTWTFTDLPPRTAPDATDRRKIKSVRPSDTRISSENLEILEDAADAEIAAGNSARAYHLLLRLRALYDKSRGTDRMKLVPTILKLAMLHESKDMNEAERLYFESIRTAEKMFGSGHPEVAKGLIGLGRLCRNRRQFDRAEPILRKALTLRQRARGWEHIELVEVMENLSEVYDATKQYAQQAPLLERIVAIREKYPDSADVALPLAKNLMDLSVARQRIGHAAPVTDLLRRSLEIKEKFLPPEHPDVAKSIANLATLYQNHGRYAEAEALYRRSIVIREKALGPEHPFVGGDLYHLAVLYMNQSRDAEAEAALRRTLGIFEKTLGDNNANVEQVCQKLARIYHRTGRMLEAEYYAARARDIQSRR